MASLKVPEINTFPTLHLHLGQSHFQFQVHYLAPFSTLPCIFATSFNNCNILQNNDLLDEGSRFLCPSFACFIVPACSRGCILLTWTTLTLLLSLISTVTATGLMILVTFHFSSHLGSNFPAVGTDNQTGCPT